MIAGRIDSYVEYTGTALTAILKQPVDKDPQQVLDTVRRLYQQRYQVAVTAPLGFENTFAMVIRGQQAQDLHLTTLSQAARYSPQWKLGVGYEFEQRPDGLPGLQQAYGLKFDGSPRLMDLGLLYRALNGRQVDIIAGNSTDGPIKAFHLAVLQDDKHYFPPYEAVPLVRQEALDRWPKLRRSLCQPGRQGHRGRNADHERGGRRPASRPGASSKRIPPSPRPVNLIVLRTRCHPTIHEPEVSRICPTTTMGPHIRSFLREM